jgi:cysteinyl-tRNA synthetase
MELRLYNTLTKEKEVFAPLDPARGVRMYVCGPTVYDFAHIGNARPVIVFDVLYRLLRHLYGEGKVKYVRNITDVDDKINARAAEEYKDLPLNEAIRLVTEKTEKQFHDDVDALGCLRPDVEPRATEHINEMRELIDRLVKAGFAYVEQEHALFEVGKMSDYGKLARRSLDEMEAGARVEVAPYKRNPMDFVLWKPSKPGEPAWPSPSGIKTPGRPGWHIECSAMSWKHLGETFDIHGGGIDLVFPHHENEIAQSRCAFHSPVMAKTWMHNGFLQVEGEKMSKSLGNFVTINELLHKWPGEVLRLQMLATHYRQPIDWTSRRSSETDRELVAWADTLWEWSTAVISSDGEDRAYMRHARGESPKPSRAIIAALCDDLNTPEAIKILRENFQRARDGGDREAAAQFMDDCEFLGIFRHDKLWVHSSGVLSKDLGAAAGDYFEDVHLLRVSIANNLPNLRQSVLSKLAASGISAEIEGDGFVTLVPLSDSVKERQTQIDSLIARRNAARARKDWKESDRIRDELKAMGVVIKDNKDGTTTWEIAR